MLRRARYRKMRRISCRRNEAPMPECHAGKPRLRQLGRPPRERQPFPRSYPGKCWLSAHVWASPRWLLREARIEISAAKRPFLLLLPERKKPSVLCGLCLCPVARASCVDRFGLHPFLSFHTLALHKSQDPRPTSSCAPACLSPKPADGQRPDRGLWIAKGHAAKDRRKMPKRRSCSPGGAAFFSIKKGSNPPAGRALPAFEPLKGAEGTPR